MKKNPTIRTLIIIGLVFLITYALADGIRKGSTIGIILALVSMLALFISIRLLKKLSQINETEDDEDNSNYIQELAPNYPIYY